MQRAAVRVSGCLKISLLRHSERSAAQSRNPVELWRAVVLDRRNSNRRLPGTAALRIATGFLDCAAFCKSRCARNDGAFLNCLLAAERRLGARKRAAQFSHPYRKPIPVLLAFNDSLARDPVELKHSARTGKWLVSV